MGKFVCEIVTEAIILGLGSIGQTVISAFAEPKFVERLFEVGQRLMRITTYDWALVNVGNVAPEHCFLTF